MPEHTELPAYLHVAAELRARITSGELAPGDKLPTETQIIATYGVSRTVAKWAISVLKGDGLVEGRRGSGVYVRQVRRLTRHGQGRSQRTSPGSTSPFARDAADSGHRGSWDHQSAHAVADLDIAHRLGIEPRDPVMVTRYVFRADGEPIQMSTSYEPLAITGGTPVEWPEDGAAVGVVARMDAIGVRIDDSEERVTARAAQPHEAEALSLPQRGAYVLVVQRSYFAAGRAVETADIVFPGDRYELVYRVPID
jgi:DNA-binding GntR family transcriptional regulator